MFSDLLSPAWSIYAVTASNPSESSWGSFCSPDDDWIDGKHVGSCLGDLFSVNWMLNSLMAGRVAGDAISSGENSPGRTRAWGCISVRSPPHDDALRLAYYRYVRAPRRSSESRANGQMDPAPEDQLQARMTIARKQGGRRQPDGGSSEFLLFT